MFHYDRAFVGVLILITTFIVPLTYLLLLGYVLGTVSILKKLPIFSGCLANTLFYESVGNG